MNIADLSAYYDGRPVVVTGGASFIGGFLSEALVGLGAQVTVVDDLSNGSLNNLACIRDQIEFRQLDLRSPGAAFEAAGGRRIMFHLAAVHGGRGFVDTYRTECLANLVIDHETFVAAANAAVEVVVFASSACIYPINLQTQEYSGRLLRESDTTADEPSPIFPDGEYGWAKLMGEVQLKAFHRTGAFDATVCRIFSAYGARQDLTHSVAALITKAILNVDPFPIWGSGTQQRNFTHVDDIVRGLLAAGARANGFTVVNLGGSDRWSVDRLAESIFDRVGWRPNVISHQVEMPVGVESRAADGSNAFELLGWKPEVTFDEGLDRTVAWYVEHKEQLEKVGLSGASLLGH